MKSNSPICHGSKCWKDRIRHDKEDMVKQDGKWYCKDCLKSDFYVSNTRNLIFQVLKKIFDLNEYDQMPLSINLQINKYINEYGFTENGIYNTLCYIYYEYDFHSLDFKYGIYPVVKEYDKHCNFQFKTNIPLKERKTRKIVAKLKPANQKVIKKIDKLELN